MRTNHGVKVTTNCVANNYAADNERIIEFSSPEGGGLISFRRRDGRLVVDVYRTDATVDVLGDAELREQLPGADLRDDAPPGLVTCPHCRALTPETWPTCQTCGELR